MLDLSQYAGARKRRGLDIIEFWKPESKESLRRASLIYSVVLERSLSRSALLKAAEVFDLAPREIELVDLLVQGLNPKEIGIRLNLSAFTVYRRSKDVMGKMGVSTRAEIMGRILGFQTRNAAGNDS